MHVALPGRSGVVVDLLHAPQATAETRHRTTKDCVKFQGRLT